MPRKNVERGKQYMHDWYVKNKDRIIARSTAYNKLHRVRRLRRYREHYAAKYRKSKLMKLYGLTSEEFDRLDPIKSCQMCARERPLTYDHDHQTGRVRGRICHSCNLGLGMLGDSIEGIVRAFEYLEGL
jgi:hypothetical protein